MEQTSDVTERLFWLILAIIACMPVYNRIKEYFENKLKKPAYFDALSIGLNVIFLFTCVAQLVGKSYNPFIYFRF
jgi:alginate O-acetyltransferase complex protein AlgI